MKTKQLTSLIALAVTISSTGCESKKTRKVTIEGPQKKTEFKMETTKKGD